MKHKSVNMTDEQMRTAIVNACKWTDVSVGLSRYFRTANEKIVGDPIYDLNAMHEAEKVFLPDLSSYGRKLTEVCDAYASIHGYNHLEGWRTTSTARQRATAFIKTLNLETE